MARRDVQSKSEVCEVLLETYAANDCMNQLLLEHLDPKAWRANSGENEREGRTLAEIFAHLHNNRLSWIRNSAPHLKCPSPLDPARCTIKQTRAAHRQSAARCLDMLKDVLSNRGGSIRVTRFSRGSWAPDWPAGATMFGYMFAHEAHHRGQVIMLAHQLGYKLPDKASCGIWRWEKLWKQCGFKTCPRSPSKKTRKLN